VAASGLIQAPDAGAFAILVAKITSGGFERGADRSEVARRA
jgi:hypothetical protein